MKDSIAAMAFALSCAASYAQQHAGAADDAAQANNPLANFTAFNLQDYHIGELTSPDTNANQFFLRYAQPFAIGGSKWLLRATVPINTFPVAPSDDKKTGLGDINAFAAYLIDLGDPAVSFGIGPQLTVPTATDDALGSGKWSAGFANVLFNAKSRVVQYGYLLTWQASFAGDRDRNSVNAAAFQTFLFYQLGGGTYLRAAPIWVYDVHSGNYSVPLGLGVGQVKPDGKTVYNFFVEPQWSVADRGPGWPKWQVFFGLNMQFKD